MRKNLIHKFALLSKRRMEHCLSDISRYRGGLSRTIDSEKLDTFRTESYAVDRENSHLAIPLDKNLKAEKRRINPIRVESILLICKAY